MAKIFNFNKEKQRQIGKYIGVLSKDQAANIFSLRDKLEDAKKDADQILLEYVQQLDKYTKQLDPTLSAEELLDVMIYISPQGDLWLVHEDDIGAFMALTDSEYAKAKSDQP